MRKKFVIPPYACQIPDYRRMHNWIGFEGLQTNDLGQARVPPDSIEEGRHDVIGTGAINDGIRGESVVIGKRF